MSSNKKSWINSIQLKDIDLYGYSLTPTFDATTPKVNTTCGAILTIIMLALTVCFSATEIQK